MISFRDRWCFLVILVLFLDAESHAHGKESVGDPSTRALRKDLEFCGVSNPSDSDRSKQQVALRLAQLRDRILALRKDSTKFLRNVQLNETTNIREITTVPVCFHVIQSHFTLNSLTNRRLQLQLDALNKAFSSNSCCNTIHSWCNHGDCSVETNIRFAMAIFSENGEYLGHTEKTTDPGACMSRVRSKDWSYIESGSSQELEMKTFLRKGDARILNVYFTFASVEGTQAGGFASSPWHYEDNPVLDGVIVDPTTTVGSWRRIAYSQGDVLHHESGHFLGLMHTFTGGCSGGDGISDTPAERSAHRGCSPGTDTCPGHPGVDPVHNFMDYGSNACMYTWTQGQVDAMHANIAAYRSENPINRDPIVLIDGAPSLVRSLAVAEVQSFVIELPTGASVECETSTSHGFVVLYMNMEGAVDCESERRYTDRQLCSVGPAVGMQTAHAFVLPTATAIDVLITCSISL